MTFRIATLGCTTLKTGTVYWQLSYGVLEERYTGCPEHVDRVSGQADIVSLAEERSEYHIHQKQVL